MRHAFMIIAHNNWWQLKNLIKLLDSSNHDIYVHIDKRNQSFNEHEFQGICKLSKVTFYQEYKVYWGGFSLVQVELFLMKQAYQIGYDYYHLISGADLPLKTNSEIDSFFEKNYGKEFIDFDETKLENDPEIERRTKLFHFLQNYRRRYKYKCVNSVFTFIERVLLCCQIALGVNRKRDLVWKIKYGSQWFSITNKLVGVILLNKDKIEKIFSYTNAGDELFVQTIAYNCGFRQSLYNVEKEKCSANMRYIDWCRGSNGNPYTFRMEDFETLVDSDAIFARKFSETVDKKIIEKITDNLK